MGVTMGIIVRITGRSFSVGAKSERDIITIAGGGRSMVVVVTVVEPVTFGVPPFAYLVEAVGFQTQATLKERVDPFEFLTVPIHATSNIGVYKRDVEILHAILGCEFKLSQRLGTLGVEGFILVREQFDVAPTRICILDVLGDRYGRRWLDFLNVVSQVVKDVVD